MLKNGVRTALGCIGLLVLNAGVGSKVTWGDREYFAKILQTNLFGVINGLNTFVPVIQA